MTYKETLDFIRANKLNVLDIDVASECDCVFDFDYTDEEFEQLCGFVSEIYLKTEDYTIWDIAQTIRNLIVDENKTITEIVAMGKWEFIDEMPY